MTLLLPARVPLPLDTVVHSDALTFLRGLPDNTVNCVVTSPPYFGLRDYQVAGQIGLEETPAAFVAKMVELFREVRRVLRGDGTCWVNLGDSYARAGGWSDNSGLDGLARGESGRAISNIQSGVNGQRLPPGMTSKNLLMIPARVAIALQDDGWVLRSEIVWHKPNPIPESVQDRPTKSHEMVYMLAKRERYFYDGDAIREPHAEPWRGQGEHESNTPHGGVLRDITGKQQAGFTVAKREYNPAGRNKRTVWTIATEPTPFAHFACVDDETECLTINGWKRQNEIKPGDVVASLDMASNKCVWSPALDIYRYEVSNQQMVAIQGRTLDMLLTPNHRCVIYRQGNERPKQSLMPPDIVRADALKTSHRVAVAAEWQDIEGEIDFNPDLAALVGWYLTEGSEGADTALLYQSGDANPEYVQEIRDLLRRVGADFTETQRTRIYKNRPVLAVTWRITGAVANELLAMCPGKSFPKDVLLWNKAALERLWDALIKGDGHFRDAGRQTFVQKRKDILDTAQALAFRLGYSTVSTKRSEGTWSLYKTDYRYRLLRSETAGLISDATYTGVVWCPRTQYGTFVARRNGKAFITGNTFPQKLIEPMILAGCPHKVCTVCGSPWVRVVEKPDMSQRPTRSDSSKMNTDAVHINNNWQGVPKSAGQKYQKWRNANPDVTLGFTPTCSHDAPTRPGIVLDPFMGSGTTALVARRLGRHYMGSELNASYVALCQERLATPFTIPMFEMLQVTA